MAVELTAVARQKRVDRFLRAADIGAAALLIYPAISIMMAVFGINATTVVVMMLASTVMWIGLIGAFFYLTTRRKTDEFTHAMWHAGTTTAFFAVIAWLMVGMIIESAIAATIVVNDPTRSDPEINTIAAWALPVTIGAFFIGFHIKRFRGAF